MLKTRLEKPCDGKWGRSMYVRPVRITWEWRIE